MRFATLAAAALFPAAALAAISITNPTSDAYWVQFTSNNIGWNYEEGDPNPITIVVSNTNDTFLNGEFSIHEFVDLALQTFTVTNVTLKVADDYQVVFVNPKNHTEVYAMSENFSVKETGTEPAEQPEPPTPSSTSVSSTKSRTASRTPTSTSTIPPNGTLSAATTSSASIVGVIAAAGIATLSALLL
ncbi:hypothetical protein BXZ70DRAFT_909565 [Cristinia sonorae]|uniref:Yeast cell wall synthesis Kre9/Knh1-like N-terminal domain-containing protein n=1 Tax=Cristinia sonorae TaxID=1940300 RepID=A0A8K0UJL3_9AGAR|nr:hypothetical protein BXZ70DRAFT_909565 [Cristinia sonorae]